MNRQNRLKEEARERMKSKFGQGGMAGIGSEGSSVKNEQHGYGANDITG